MSTTAPKGWDAMRDRLALPVEHPDRPHVGWHWYVDGVPQPDTDLMSAVAEAKVGRGFIWCGLKDPDDAEMLTFQEIFDLHDLAAEDAVEGHTRSKLELFNDSLFMVISTVDYVPHAPGSITSEIVSTGQVMAYLGDWFVLTARHGGKPFMNRVRLELEAEPDALADGPWRVLYKILDRVVDDFTETITEFEADVDAVEVSIFSTDVRPDVDRLYNVKRELIEFKRCVFPLVAPAQRLHQGAVWHLPAESHAYFREVSDHLLEAKESIAALDEVLGTLIQAALTRISLEDNQDMRRLSALVAILALPALIGSIYGMNFDHMPELHSPYGYYTVLGVMVAWVIGAIILFRRRGWL